MGNNSRTMMYQNLSALHAIDPANQETISVKDIYEVTDALASLPSLEPIKPSKKQTKKVQEKSEMMTDLEWPLSEKEFRKSFSEKEIWSGHFLRKSLERVFLRKSLIGGVWLASLLSHCI